MIRRLPETRSEENAHKTHLAQSAHALLFRTLEVKSREMLISDYTEYWTTSVKENKKLSKKTIAFSIAGTVGFLLIILYVFVLSGSREPEIIIDRGVTISDTEQCEAQVNREQLVKKMCSEKCATFVNEPPKPERYRACLKGCQSYGDKAKYAACRNEEPPMQRKCSEECVSYRGVRPRPVMSNTCIEGCQQVSIHSLVETASGYLGDAVDKRVTRELAELPRKTRGKKA